MLLLEAAINRYLALDPELLPKLAAFEGRVIRLNINLAGQPALSLYLLPGERGIQVLRDYDGEVDTELSGSPLALLRMAMVPNVATLLLAGDIEISGDTRLGHRFKQLLSQMQIDWAAPLAELFGDGVAWQVESNSRELARRGKTAANSLLQDSAEYLVEESRDIVSQAELEQFYQQVDELRDASERLEARLHVQLAGLNTSREKRNDLSANERE